MKVNGQIVLSALEDGDTAIVVFRPDQAGVYRIVETNGTFSRMTNYTGKEAVGMLLSDLQSASTSKAMQQKMDEAMRASEGLRGEIEYVSRVGRAFWLGFTLMPIVDPVTHRPNCVMLGRDITEKRKQEAEQSAMQTMLAQVFQKIDAPVSIIRSDGFILLTNAAFQALSGYTAAELSRLMSRQLTPPEFHEIVTAAHVRQFADGKPFKLDTALICKDGSQIPVQLSSVLLQRVDRQDFRVVTLRELGDAVAPVAVPFRRSAVLGCVQFLGLDAIKEAYGARWDTAGERLLLKAERILKRRLTPEDVFSRTADQGFCIWFKDGSEEDNAGRVTRIGREIRIMLLGELGDDANVSVCAYAQTADIEDPGASSAAMMTSFNRLTTERRLETERLGKEFLDDVMKRQPSESRHLLDQTGRAIRASFVVLPRELQGRFAGAMSLVSGQRAEIDMARFELTLATNAILEDVAQGRDDIRLTEVPIGLFVNRKQRDEIIKQMRTYPASIGQRLMIMLSQLPPKLDPLSIIEIASAVRTVCKRIGVMVDDIETLPPNLLSLGLSIVGLVSDSVIDTPEMKMRSFIQKVHEAKARVLVRLSVAEPPLRWHSFGADLTTPA